MKDNSKQTVAVDLDGVLARYDKWRGIDHIGLPIPGARVFMAHLSRKYHVVVYTTRTNAYVNIEHSSDALARKVIAWLQEHDIPYDEVYASEGKPIASAYVDDRAVSCRPQDFKDPSIAYDSALIRVDMLSDEIKGNGDLDYLDKPWEKDGTNG